MEASRPSKRALVAAFLALWLVYGFYAAGWIGNPMGNSILDLTVRMVDDRTLTIDPYRGNTVEAAARDGHYYSGMPPGASVLAVPLYVAARPILDRIPAAWNERAAEMTTKEVDLAPTPRRAVILALSMLFVLLMVAPAAASSVILVRLIAGRVWGSRVSARALNLGAALFAFGTIHFYYASNVEHRSLSGAALLGAFSLLLVERDAAPTRWRPVAAGALMAVATTITSDAAVISMIVVAYAATWLRWRIAWVALGAAGPLALLLAYNAAAFGSPFASAYGFRVDPTGAPPLFLHGVGIDLDPGRLLGYLTGSAHGIFFYSPILLVGLLPLLRRRAPRDVWFGWALVAVMLGFHYVTGYRGLPGEYGFRLMAAAIPFAAIALPGGIDAIRRRWVLWSVSALSVGIVFKGVMWGLAARGFALLGPAEEWGFTNYVLRQASDHVRHLGPVVITALHLLALAGLAGLLLLVRRWATRPQGPAQEPAPPLVPVSA